MWQDVSIAPSDRDLQLAVIDRDGAHLVIFPCRRTAGGWIDARSRRHIDVRPTHWRLCIGSN
jgi:hypothetical protein